MGDYTVYYESITMAMDYKKKAMQYRIVILLLHTYHITKQTILMISR